MRIGVYDSVFVVRGVKIGEIYGGMKTSLWR